MHTLDSRILREYDIRGRYGETLHDKDVQAFGQKFAVFLQSMGKSTVVVGRDGRVSSPALCEHLIQGLLSGGLTVYDVGLGPTPMAYFGLKHLKSHAAIMVTGSHNPAEDNGLKMTLDDRPLTGADIREIAALDESKLSGGVGRLESKDIFQDYITRLLQDYRPGQRKWRIAWDPGNGATGQIVTDLIRKIDGDHFIINGEIDGCFPAHHPDPTVAENLEQLIALINQNKCDFGFAFDGDGDRLGVVDGQGRILWGDQITMLLARDVVMDNPGATIIADVKSSQVLFDDISARGGKPLMCKTGHSLIKAKIKETGALLAGEMSGHIFFSDKYYGFDDALYAAIRLIGYINREGRTLVEIYNDMPKMHSTPEIRIDCPDEVKFGVVDAVRNRLTHEGATMDTTDGVRVQRPDGWWLLRASNTGPILVARCESATEEGLNRLKADFEGYVQRASV